MSYLPTSVHSPVAFGDCTVVVVLLLLLLLLLLFLLDGVFGDDSTDKENHLLGFEGVEEAEDEDVVVVEAVVVAVAATGEAGKADEEVFGEFPIGEIMYGEVGLMLKL